MKRNLNGTNARIGLPAPEIHQISASGAKENGFPKHDTLPQLVNISSTSQKSVATVPKAATQSSKVTKYVKEASAGKSTNASDISKAFAVVANKKNAQNGKATGGALASFWGRASSKRDEDANLKGALI